MSGPPIPDPTVADSASESGRLRFAFLAALAALFFSFSLDRSPIPGVNEPHYLTKAKHFWEPNWCQDDLFLKSANPHAVFYAVFGKLTKTLSLEQTALIIRVGQSILLACGWMALATRCLGDARRAFTAAVLFMLWQATGTWSGEWMIGGAESKVWAYGFLLLAAAWGLDRRWVLASLSGGAAVSMHPVVGSWGAIIALLASAANRMWARVRTRTEMSTPEINSGAQTSSPGRGFGVFVVSITVLVLTSLPGVIPALQSLDAPNARIASEADYLQVAVRLPHHLDPMTFSVRAWRDYGLLLLVLALVRVSIKTRLPALTWLERWMRVSLLIAGVGVLIAWGPRPLKELPWWELRVKLLKLYPFRLADMLVPMTVAMTCAAAVWEWGELKAKGPWRRVIVAGAIGGALLIAYRVPSLDKTLDQQPVAVQTDWHAACRWIREHTPSDAVLYATSDNWSLRWYTGRTEYFHFKDCPQDAVSIVEWNNRHWALYNWKLRTFVDGTASKEDLSQLRKQTGITHLVCGRFGPVEIKPVFSSTNIFVYELP